MCRGVAVAVGGRRTEGRDATAVEILIRQPGSPRELPVDDGVGGPKLRDRGRDRRFRIPASTGAAVAWADATLRIAMEIRIRRSGWFRLE